MPGLLTQATALFALANIDSMIVLAAIFALGGRRATVFAGQYAGFAAILAVAYTGSLGAGLLPSWSIRCLGLIPLAMGLRLAWLQRAWSLRRDDRPLRVFRPTALSVAAIAFANGGDNIATYVPLFASLGAARTLLCCAVFLLLVALWCVLGLALAKHPLVARVITRGGRMALPVVLVVIGALILCKGATFAPTPL